MEHNKVLETIVDTIEWIITALLIAIFAITVLLVILRYVFNSSILGASEVVSFMFIYTTALGAAAAIPKNRHIRISYFIDHLPPALHAAVEFLVFLCIAGINAVMMIYSLGWIRTVGRDVSQSLEIPLGIVKASVPIGCTLAVIFALWAAIGVLRDAFGKEGRRA